MTPSESSLRRTRISVGSITTVAIAIAAALALVTFPVRGTGVAGGGLPWLVLFALSFVVERFPVRLHFKGEAHALILTEVPIVLGLFLVTPVQLVLVRVGSRFLDAVVIGRQRPVKAVLNLAVSLLETVAAIAIFTALHEGLTTSDRNLLVALVASVVGSFVGAVPVWAAIGISNRDLSYRELAATLRLSAPTWVANASAGLVAVVVAAQRPSVLWTVVPLVTVLVLGYRLFFKERENRQILTMLYELARDTHAAPDVAAALQRMVEAVRSQVRARVVELYVIRPTGPAALVTSVAADPTPHRTTVDELPADVHVALVDSGPLRTLDRGGRCTALTYGIDVGRGRHVVFRLREPLGDVTGFDASSLAVLAATATHATALLEDAEVHDAKNAFLSAVSHELRTPLSVVLGSAETLERIGDALSDAQRATLIDRLHGQAQKLDRLLHDLLDVDRLNRGVMVAQREETDVLQLVHRTIDTLDIKSHTILVEGDAPLVSVDPSQLERVVENLVLNAVKYCPFGSTVRVHVTRDQATARVVVSDEGPGIPDPDKERVFEPFLRLDRSHPTPGTGVGLSLVHRFVELHGGRVWVEDVEPTGARFIVELPIETGPAEHAPGAGGPNLRLVSGG